MFLNILRDDLHNWKRIEAELMINSREAKENMIIIHLQQKVFNKEKMTIVYYMDQLWSVYKVSINLNAEK